MHSKSDNIEFMIYNKTEEVVGQVFESGFNEYEIGLETSARSNDFIFDCFHLLCYKYRKINANRGGSYIDSPDWVKNKKATTNPISQKDNKCFQYHVTVVLNHEEIKKYPQRITKIKPFINKYNLEEINCPLEKND